MNSRVTYLDESRGEARTVTLVHPSEADAALGRISVLSPVGRALLGQRPGAVVAVTASNGNAMRLRILGAEKASATHA
jgi:regulator of nucleoside diphosphate kinase